jgi:rhodanese-related sulfurtransferase
LYAPGAVVCAVFVLLLVTGAAFGCGRAAATISDRELLEQLGSGNPPLVLDVRTPAEFASGHIEGALNVPHDQIGERLEELSASRDREVVVYCERGPRAAQAADVLERAGFRLVRHLDGDMGAWRSNRLPCVGC